MSIEQQHRAGPLKQQNKKHKTGKHRSKGQIELLKKGKVNVKTSCRKKKLELSREEKRNKASQLRKKKREDFLEKRRGLTDAPFLVAIISLNASINHKLVLDSLKNADSEASVVETPEGHIHINVPRWKQRFTLVVVDNDNLFDVLDVLKVASTVIFLTSVNGNDEEGNITLTACLAQGLPSAIVVVTDISTIPIKKRQECKNQLQCDLARWLPEEKVMGLEKDSDGLNILRRIGNQKVKELKLRDLRPHLLAERVEFIETVPGKGRVSLSGYLRGATLNVNSLVHIPGWGDFKMSSIDAGPNYDQLKLLERADPNLQESLVNENPIDPMDAEQTWPTKEDIEDAEKERKKLVKKVPKGFSDYQAAWIPDNDAFEITESENESDEGMEEDEAMSDGSSSCYEDAESAIDDTETTPSEIPPDKYDSHVDFDEEKNELEKLKRAKEDKDFPDEVDTPLEIPAKDRFCKYRGLLSFRTTPWDVKENLPIDYARIFQFKNFTRTKNNVLKKLEEHVGGAQPGCYVRVHVEDVSTYLIRYRDPKQPIVLCGMLEHEQKMSVVNMLLKRLPGDDLPLKSKETLLFQCGYRRYKAAPVYSQHTTGNKHKYERFFQPDTIAVGTTFAPIIYPPSPVLAFKENRDGSLSLVATGNVLSVSPDRLVIKRTILSGHLFKVNRKSAVVRFMFFNRDDINWFKPVELKTKYGRRGHIKEPLGTHGHMKCVFNGALKSQDTVLMHLYKRVYPKWTYNPHVTFTKVLDPIDEEKKMDED